MSQDPHLLDDYIKHILGAIERNDTFLNARRAHKATVLQPVPH